MKVTRKQINFDISTKKDNKIYNYVTQNKKNEKKIF